MGQATLATVDALLKEVYGPRLENQLQEETHGIKRIERTSEGVVETAGGKYVDFPIRVGRNHGQGYRKENEQLPAAKNQQYAEVHVPLRYGYGRARFTGQLMELAETNVQAFASAFDEEMDRLKTDTAKTSNRIFYLDGTGLLASVAVDMGVPGNTFEVDNLQYLEEGMQVDILVIATGAVLASDREITAIDDATNEVTVDGATFTATTPEHGVYLQGDFTDGDQREPSGLDLIIDDTAVLHGVDPATERKWKAVISTAGAPRALSEGLMIKVCDDIRVKGGARPTVIFNNLGVRRAYFNLLTQQRRYTDTKEFAGGFQGLPFNYGKEIPVVEDVDAPNNEMDFVTENKIKIYRNKEWHWMDKDGSALKWVNGFDAYESVLRQYWEIGTSQRNAHGKLDQLIEG